MLIKTYSEKPHCVSRWTLYIYITKMVHGLYSVSIYNIIVFHANNGWTNAPQCYVIQSDSLARGPKLFSIKNYVIVIERRPFSASILNRSCFATFSVCVYKFSSHYLNNIMFIDNSLGPLARESPCTYIACLVKICRWESCRQLICQCSKCWD